MRFLLDAILAFLVLGVTEAVLKPIAKRWVQRRMLAAAPVVLKHLDERLPSLLLISDANGVESYVRELFEEATGEDWSTADLNPFFRLFDIRKAAQNR